jgi:cytochrome c biogenesis protein ResB
MNIKKICHLLAGIKLFIAVLAICSVVSLAGIIIPQNGDYDGYSRQFGPGFAEVIIRCGWNHIFSSLLFIIPLAALCINCIFCLGNRLFNLSTSLRQDKKGSIGAAGSFLLHTGILILVAGGLIQYYSGDRQLILVEEGTQENLDKFNSKIFLSDFSIIRNSKNEIVNYRSVIEVRDMTNHVVVNSATMVNSPLTWHGLYFYQMTYGLVSNAVKSFCAVVTDTAEDTLFNGMVPYKSDFLLGKDDLSLRCTGFLCNFYYDFENQSPATRSHDHDNPAFRITMFHKGVVIDSQWVFRNFPSMSGRFGPYSVTIPSYTPLFYSGIQVQKKNGTPFIFTGIICVSIGLMATFLFPFKRRK